MHALGRYFRKVYIERTPFLSDVYSNTELKVVSSDTRRTIQSAEAVLQGLYPQDKRPLKLLTPE